ncbi:MAG: hypothetical protein ACK50Q_07295 [Labrys sp. (in: a-proteobacteria)]|jgi:hypothetical protein
MVQLRKMLRWLHILGGLYIGTLLFSPLIEIPAAVLAAQIVSLALLATGVSMWQWSRLNSALRRIGGK